MQRYLGLKMGFFGKMGMQRDIWVKNGFFGGNGQAKGLLG